MNRYTVNRLRLHQQTLTCHFLIPEGKDGWLSQSPAKNGSSLRISSVNITQVTTMQTASIFDALEEALLTVTENENLKVNIKCPFYLENRASGNLSEPSYKSRLLYWRFNS